MDADTPEPRRVLHVAPTPFFSDRGCHMRIAGIVRSLQAAGYDNRVCTYHLGRDVDGVKTVRTWRIPGYTKTGAGHSPFKYLADLLLFVVVCREVLRYRPHVIHGHLHEGALLGYFARLVAPWRRTPLVFDVQGSLAGELVAYGKLESGSVAHRVFRKVEWFVCRLPDVLMCSSSNSLALMRDEYAVPERKLMVTADGTDVSAFEVPRDESLAARLGLPRDRAVAVFSGSLLSAKGVEELKIMIEGAAKAALPVHFLVIGYPHEELRDWLESRGMAGYATLTGQLPFETLPGYLALADLAIEPKAVFAGEASGKLINYMAAGLPVICFESKHNREVLADTGFYADPATRDLLPALREALAESPSALASRGAANRRRAAQRYSWSATARAITERYAQL